MRTITNSGGLRRRAGYYCDRLWNFRKKKKQKQKKQQREFAASFVFKKVVNANQNLCIFHYFSTNTSS